MFTEDDVHYAMEMTKVVHEPDRRIDTFGTTSFEFHLISELMDSINQVRVRSGKIHAEQPLILRPNPESDLTFEGFGDQAEAFREWVAEHCSKLSFLQYGFNFRKSDMSEVLLHDPLPDIRDRVVAEAHSSGNPLSAVIEGVDDTWEISLLKFTLQMIAKSHDTNMFDFKRRGFL